MAKNQIEAGNNIDVLAPANVLSGAGVLIGSLFGVASEDALQGVKLSIMTTGVFEMPKLAAQAWTVGEPVYWDNTANKECTTVAGSNTLIGVATEVAANPSDVGRVRLNGPPGLLAGIVASTAVADLTENGGAIGGTNNGDLPSLTATAATVTGTLTGATDGVMADVPDIALSTSNTYTDAAVNSAVNAAILAVNLELKELQTALNEVTADNVALRAAIRENSAIINTILARLRTTAVIGT